MMSSESLDAEDPLARFRELFLLDAHTVSYLDGNSLGRPLIASRERITSFISEQWGSRLVRGWSEGWLDLPGTIGDELGRVALGAAAGQVTIGDSTTVVLYKLIRAAVDARPGRTEIVVERSNFATHRSVVEAIAAEGDFTVTWIDGQEQKDGVTADQLAGVLSDNTAVVVLSHVAHRSGFLADVPAVTAVAHAAGALVVWDLSHSVGVVPTFLDEWGVDLAAGCSHKYLNGGPGSPAFAYVREELHNQLRQPTHWFGSKAPHEVGQDGEPADGTPSIVSATTPILGMLAMQDTIALIDEVGIDAIRMKSIALTEFAIDLADELLPDARLASPRNSADRGSHITLDIDGSHELVPKLWAQGVIPDFREPGGIRMGLSPLSTSFAEVEVGLWAMRYPSA